MSKIAIIGAGISGLATAEILKDTHDVVVYEKDNTVGGLIRCKRVDGALFLQCGGHTMKDLADNTVKFLDRFFDQSVDITTLERNSAILFENGEVSKPEYHGLFKKKLSEIEGVPSPIENHIYMFKPEIQQKIIADIFRIKAKQKSRREPKFLATFLKAKYGETLYDMYFRPYNEKLWHSDLRKIPMSWLQGKNNPPTANEILFANFNHNAQRNPENIKTFRYILDGGAQLLVDKVAQSLGNRIVCNTEIESIERQEDGWNVNGEIFDVVIYCANIRNLPKILKSPENADLLAQTERLKYHGITSVFCDLDKNPYTEVYLPGKEHKAHKIICTGNFDHSNNSETHKMTGTVEFTDYISEDEIRTELINMPLHPQYIAHHYTECTRPIQDIDTRALISDIKNKLEPSQFYLTGMLAEWEHYNINSAIDSATKTCNILNSK